MLQVTRKVMRSALLLCFIATGVAAQDQPLRDLPAGWVYLPSPSPDSWIGAYHDRESGSFVQFQVDHSDLASYWTKARNSDSSDVVSSGEVGGLPYQMVKLGGNARARFLRAFKADTGAPLPDYLESTLPPEHSSGLIVTFRARRKGEIYNWNFRSDVCDELQERRTRALLLEGSRLRLDPATASPPPERAPDLDAFRFVKSGIDLGTVVAKLGLPTHSERYGSDGFVATYSVVTETKDGETLVSVRITFSRDQRVAATEVK
jgi:hypothetical protein